MEKKRVVYLDYLRVAATVSVIILHAASQNWSDLDPGSFTWNIFNFYDSAVRWGVPVFVMISGSIFLSREIPIRKLYGKNILRMLTAYCFWSVFYAIAMTWVNILKDPSYGIWLKSIVLDMIGGWYHLWFLPLIAGMYMCVPLLRQMLKTREARSYYLVLAGVFTLVIPQAVTLVNDFVGGNIAEVANAANGVVSNMHMHTVLGYGFFFVLGWSLSNWDLSKKQRKNIYALGGLGFLATLVLTWAISRKLQQPMGTYYEYFNVNVALEAVAIFTWARYSTLNREKWNALVAALSKYSFGAYLVHIFVMEFLDVMGFDTLCFPPVIAVPVVSLAVLVISFAVSFGIHQIPVLKKWIV